MIYDRLATYDSSGLILFDQMREENILSLSRGFGSEAPDTELPVLQLEETKSIYREDSSTVYMIRVA